LIIIKTALSIFALSTFALAGEVLYNGIELPDKWPPQILVESIRRGDPMPVPYLDHPPKVILIDVGRQLFVDDFLIESTTLTRRYHACEEYQGNPVLRPEKRWEIRDEPQSAMAFSDGCFYDPKDQVFKIWYRHGNGRGTRDRKSVV
jgi:hypothetical protein